MYTFVMIPRFFIVLLFLVPNAQALAEECYDYPANSQLSPRTFSPYKRAVLGDRRYRGAGGRYTLWSDYKGVRNNERSISPNRWIWESLFVSCKAKPNGERRYFYFAKDAETGLYLTSPVVMHGKQPKPANCPAKLPAEYVDY
jgi:hypothetical protein